MENERLFNETIILIGPSGAGKSTVGQILSERTNIRRVSIDRIANKARKTGFMSQFKTMDDFKLFVLKDLIRRGKEDGKPSIVDAGAGHSVFEDKEKFDEAKKELAPFKNIVLLMPSEDIDESIRILASRSTGDYSPNRHFIESPCNKELATMTVYENGRTPEEIADEIQRKIAERKKKREENDAR